MCACGGQCEVEPQPGSNASTSSTVSTVATMSAAELGALRDDTLKMLADLAVQQASIEEKTVQLREAKQQLKDDLLIVPDEPARTHKPNAAGRKQPLHVKAGGVASQILNS